MIWTTVYNPAIDVIYPIDDVSTSNTFTDIPSNLFPAGKGLNFAKVVKALGEEVSVMAIMPDADKHRFADYLSHKDIPFHFYSVPGVVRVNCTIYEKNSGMVQHFNSAGQSYSTQVQDLVKQELLSLLRTGDYLVLSGSLPQGMETTTYAEIIEECHHKQIPVALDTRGIPLFEGIQCKPTVITPNEEEVCALYDQQSRGLRSLIERGKHLIEEGIPSVFITLGADGVVALNGRECILCKSPEIITVDTVGCGDAFLAGVVVGNARGFTFQECCRLAVACGSSNAESTGPGEIDAERVWQIMEKVTITSV